MSEKKVVLMEFESNPNIGLYMFANDKFAIIGKEIDKKKQEEIQSVLNVPLYKTTVLGTDLIGVFVAGNNEMLIIPQMYDYELEVFKKIAKETDMKLIELNTIQNTLGNNLCIGKDKILFNPQYDKKFQKQLQTKTGCNIIPVGTKELPSTGAICKYTNSKFYISQELSEEDVKDFIEEIGGIGTVNSGSNFIASGIISNKNGIILGSASSTIEIQNIVESLDYL